MAEVTAYIALGGNLGDPLATFHRALAAMSRVGLRVTAVAPAYRTAALQAPGDVDAVPDYWNSACAVETGRKPHATLAVLRAIEQRLGRRRDGRKRWKPRTLDLDLVLYGRTAVQTPDLILPHPGLAGRIFVLRPLCDIAPDALTPRGERISDLLAGHADPTAGILETRRDW